MGATGHDPEGRARMKPLKPSKRQERRSAGDGTPTTSLATPVPKGRETHESRRLVELLTRPDELPSGGSLKRTRIPREMTAKIDDRGHTPRARVEGQRRKVQGRGRRGEATTASSATGDALKGNETS
jgi:hypothetical protein